MMAAATGINAAWRLRAVALLLCLAGCSSTGDPGDDSGFDPVTMDLPSIDGQNPPGFRGLEIPSHGVRLTGFVLTANGAGPHPTVILLHGFPGNEKNLDLAQSLRRAGFNVLFFHYRGAWGSQGEYSLDHIAEDVASVLSFLRANAGEYSVDVDRISLVGHSLGGYASLRGAANDDGVICVAGIATANFATYVADPEQDPGLLAGLKAMTDRLFMLEGFNGAQLIQELQRGGATFDVTTYGPELVGKSVLLLTGSDDTVVPPSVQEAIVEAYSRVDGIQLEARVIPGDHSFSANRIELQRNVVGWLQRRCR